MIYFILTGILLSILLTQSVFAGKYLKNQTFDNETTGTICGNFSIISGDTPQINNTPSVTNKSCSISGNPVGTDLRFYSGFQDNDWDNYTAHFGRNISGLGVGNVNNIFLVKEIFQK